MDLLHIFILMFNAVSGSIDYVQFSPDGIKDLWCPKTCFDGISELESRHCCACDGIPEWQLPQALGQLADIHVEILNVQHTKGYLRPTSTSLPSQLIFVGGDIHVFPENACSITHLVKIDVSENRFTEIGNLSCFIELDTLIMSRNLITTVSNETFLYLNYLRYIDLSYNQIYSMDYNVFQISKVFTLNLDGNILKELDVANIYKVNKTTCASSYANNRYSLDITNIGNVEIGEGGNQVCSDTSFENVSISSQPLLQLYKLPDIRLLYKYVPCGITNQDGTGWNCDCSTGEFISLSKIDLSRFIYKSPPFQYCYQPEVLANVSIYDVYKNQTLQDLMICDVVDYCPRNGNCKCTCTSQPSRQVFIVDCSNQSCTDFPERVPENRHAIILNMSYNKITHIHTRRSYFPQVKILDLTGNAIQRIEEDIAKMTVATDVIIVDHKLSNLPNNIKLLDPNIFYFGNNGIPCSCENRWIGQWRKFKNASKQFPYALACSNLERTLFEDMYLQCDKEKSVLSMYLVIGIFLFIISIIATLLVYYCFKYEIVVFRRKIKSNSLHREIWDIDVYISFDDDVCEIRTFVLVVLEKFLRKNKMTTYIPCRDAWVGLPEEENVRNHMKKCKYVLIIQSSGMYESADHQATRRFEYRHAWNSFVKFKVAKLFIIKFDNDDHKFMKSRTKAMRRFDLVFDIFDRTKSLFNAILNNFDYPITANSKYQFQKKVLLKTHLKQKRYEKYNYD